MREKTATGILLMCLLTSIAMLAFGIQPVEATETIYIQADGSVSPSTAPIQRSGDFYTFTDNIFDSIWVLRDNIVIDGAGYTLQGTASIVQGIRLAGRTNVTVQNTQIKTFQNGIVISDYSSNIAISGNIITKTNNGLLVRYSSSTSISGNNIANNSYGMRLEYSSSNSISGNTITNERGIYFYNSSSNSVSGNNITNTYYGIQLESYSNFNNISENNIIANTNSGIVLSGSSNDNTISGNNIANNGEGISLTYSSVSSNRIYHNNFIDNTQQAYSLGIGNSWDNGYPSGGNYWSDYNGTDSDPDGIGDTEYVIDSDNIDHYPLMGMFNSYNVTYFTPPIVPHTCNVIVISNSTISDFVAPVWIEHPEVIFLMFNVSGVEGSTGFCRVSFPTAMMNGTYHVSVNGTEIPYTLLPCSDVNYSYLYFSYTHSTQEVIITPEFPSFLILPLFMIATLLAVIFYKRKQTL